MLNLLVLVVINFLCYQLNYAQVYEYKFTPSVNIDPQGYAHYKIYIPETVDTIKGVYCYVPGWQGSSLDMINNSVYKEYVKEKGFALLCFQMLGSYTDYYKGVSLWAGEALVHALKELSILSKHPELEYSALLFDGHSAGGQFSYHFTLYKPERVIAFVTIKGGYHTLSSAGNAIDVPACMFIGEIDLDYRLTNLTSIFEINRQNGAFWCLAKEPDAGHGRISKDIIHSYFDEIIPLRLPKAISVGTIPTLEKLQEQNGWLGDPKTYSIASFVDYKSNSNDACWFPNEKIAKEWQSFVSRNYNFILNSSENNKIKIYPNPANDIIQISQEKRSYNIQSYKIISTSGQIVKQGILENNIINVCELTNGFYTLILITDNTFLHKKIVIE